MAKGTILVNLKRDWFAPDGSLYQVRDNPHEFPASFEDQFPSSAEKVGEDVATAAVVQNTASGSVIVSSPIEGDVKSVGGALDDKGFEQPSQSVAKAEAGAKEVGVDQVGGKPRESGPLPAGTKKPS